MGTAIGVIRMRDRSATVVRKRTVAAKGDNELREGQVEATRGHLQKKLQVDPTKMAVKMGKGAAVKPAAKGAPMPKRVFAMKRKTDSPVQSESSSSPVASNPFDMILGRVPIANAAGSQKGAKNKTDDNEGDEKEAKKPRRAKLLEGAMPPPKHAPRKAGGQSISDEVRKMIQDRLKVIKGEAGEEAVDNTDSTAEPSSAAGSSARSEAGQGG